MASDPQPDLPATMRALQVSRYGDPSVLQYVETKTPQLTAPTDLIVKVHVAGVNPVEAKIRSGNVSTVIRSTPPCIVGRDFSGTVVSTGDKVTKYNIGDDVFGMLPNALGFGGGGSYAEYIRVPVGETAMAKKPANVTHKDVGGAGVPVNTVWRALVAQGKIKSLTSPKVIVIGASGGVGTYGVQIAKALGAYVIGICSGRNAELVKSLGADVVLDYTVQDSISKFASENKDTFDIVLDAVGGDDYWKLLAPTLKPAGVYSTAAGPVEHNGSEKVGYGQIARIVATVGARKLFGSRKYEIIGMLPPDDMTEIANLFEEGKVKTHIPAEQIFSLKDGAKAHEVIESHRSVGKVILLVDE